MFMRFFSKKNRSAFKNQFLLHMQHRAVTAMNIIAVNPEEVARSIIGASEEAQLLKIEPIFRYEDRETCYLDPGGMYFLNTPHEKFNIEGIDFDIQLTKIGMTLEDMEWAQECIPGYYRIKMWFWNTILPKTLFEALRNKLKELALKDEALHAHLNENAVFEDLEEKRTLYRIIPREAH